MASEEHKAHQGATWGAGSYELIPPLYEPMLDHLLDRLQPWPGERWLDVATGTGAVAERAAAADADATGIDLAPALIDTARRRATEAGLAIVYEVGDAEDLPYPDGSFDVVVSNLGAMYAPDHGAVARELGRVCRGRGRLGLTCWQRDPSISGLSEVRARFDSGSQERFETSLAWSDPAHVEELLGESFELSFEVGDAPLVAASGADLWEVYSTGHGPTRTLAESLDDAERAELRAAFVAFHEEFRTDQGICKPGPYLLVTGRRR